MGDSFGTSEGGHKKHGLQTVRYGAETLGVVGEMWLATRAARQSARHLLVRPTITPGLSNPSGSAQLRRVRTTIGLPTESRPALYEVRPTDRRLRCCDSPADRREL